MDTKSDTIILTDDLLAQCTSPRGGICAEMVRTFGDDMAIKGWRQRIIGKSVSLADFNHARTISKLPKLKHVPLGECRGQMSLLQ